MKPAVSKFMQPGHDLAMTVGEYLDMVQMQMNVSNTLPGNLLDAHFLYYSPIAKKIRETVLKEGFQFKQLRDPDEMNFFWMSGVFVLNYMYERRTIFYHKNDEAMANLVRLYPQFRNSPMQTVGVVMDIPGNKTVHEGLHMLNFKKFFGEKLPGFTSDQTLQQQGETMMKYLVIESVVLTVEFLSSLVPNIPVSRIAAMMGCNHAAHYPEDFSTLLGLGAKSHGAHVTFEILFYSYLGANLYPNEERPPQALFEKLVAQYRDAELVRKVLEIAFRLSVRFRATSNPLYFASMGFEGDYNSVASTLDWDWVAGHELTREVMRYNYDEFLKDTFFV